MFGSWSHILFIIKSKGAVLASGFPETGRLIGYVWVLIPSPDRSTESGVWMNEMNRGVFKVYCLTKRVSAVINDKNQIILTIFLGMTHLANSPEYSPMS